MKARLQSSTLYPIMFLLVDSTDHVTGKTGLTPTVTISKNGAAFASPAGAVTELGSGWYALAGNATDRATLGDLIIHATGTGADPVDDRYVIVAFNPFLATLGSGVVAASVTGAVGSVTAAVNVGTIAADAITDSEISTAAAQKIADVIFRRTMASIEASANGETLSVESLYGLIAAAFEASLASTTLTVRKSDGSTLGTKTLTTDAAAVPVTGIT